MGWIGLDDTDSVEGGCTTWDFHLLLSYIEDSGYEIKSPRLVRLWPFAPDRTRGNAALSAEVIIAPEQEEEFKKILGNWFEERYSSQEGIKPKEDTAHPSLVWSPVQLPEEWYWGAVRGY
ncbi:MAG TPA: hypothetical protein QF621_01765, partial [Candidatus Thalassarchaeaceae archaeon]|nr:hypothetical protein [Candidatus Thalassarchaeaceae archaeon]